jgi:dynein heavy chain
MDATPGGADEARVAPDARLGRVADLDERVRLLVDTATATVFGYVSQGLFERHKLIVSTQLCVAVLRQRGELQQAKFEVLLRGPKVMGVDNPLADWVPESVWGAVQALRELDDYASLADDLVGSAKRWREWMELERPGKRDVGVVGRQGCLFWHMQKQFTKYLLTSTTSTTTPQKNRGRAAAGRLEAHARV